MSNDGESCGFSPGDYAPEGGAMNDVMLREGIKGRHRNALCSIANGSVTLLHLVSEAKKQ